MDASKNLKGDVMSTNCDIITIFPTYAQFGAIQKPDSGRMVGEICIFNRKEAVFLKNICWFFCKRNAGISKNKGVFVLKGIYSETKYACGLMYQISSF